MEDIINGRKDGPLFASDTLFGRNFSAGNKSSWLIEAFGSGVVRAGGYVNVRHVHGNRNDSIFMCL